MVKTRNWSGMGTAAEGKGPFPFIPPYLIHCFLSPLFIHPLSLPVPLPPLVHLHPPLTSFSVNYAGEKESSWHTKRHHLNSLLQWAMNSICPVTKDGPQWFEGRYFQNSEERRWSAHGTKRWHTYTDFCIFAEIHKSKSFKKKSFILWGSDTCQMTSEGQGA